MTARSSMPGHSGPRGVFAFETLQHEAPGGAARAAAEQRGGTS